MATRDYEITLIVDTQLQEGSVDEAVQRYQDLLTSQGAELANTDRWGVRKLAYEIRKRQQGDYTLFQFQADPASIAEVDRACRLDEEVLRHLIIQVQGGVQPVEEEVDPGSEAPAPEAADEETEEEDVYEENEESGDAEEEDV